MIIKFAGWLTTQLTKCKASLRHTDYFNVLKETEKAYQVAYLRDSEPIGWVAKSLVIDKKDDDTEEFDKYIKSIEKSLKEIDESFKSYNGGLSYEEKKEKDRNDWLENNKDRLNYMRTLENENTWLSVHADDTRGYGFMSCGFSNVDSLIDYLKELDLMKYNINFNSIDFAVKDKDCLCVWFKE